jgi:hypothetical protein
MQERTTQVLLAGVGGLLVAQLVLSARGLSGAAQEAPAVLRAQAIELVDRQGQAVVQLFLGEDGGGNLRLRSGDGSVRVKLGATADGSGLLLLDKDAEPGVWLATNKSGTSITLAEKGKEKRILKP